MSSFDDRQRGYEGKFARDAETEFKMNGRRNRLLGEWAGGLLGKSGDELTAYAREVVRSDFEAAGDEDVLRKVSGDLQGKASEAEVRTKMDALLEEARRQIEADG